MADTYDSDGYGIDAHISLYGERDPLQTPEVIAVEVDNIGPWLCTIDVGHHQTHEGDGFSCIHTDSTLADGETIVILLKNPAANYPHLLWHATCPSAFTVALYENPTVSVAGDGTAVTLFNRNRNKTSITPLLAVYHTPTTTNNGTLLEQFYIGGGAQRAGGDNRATSEWVLKANEDYLLIITSRANGNSGAVVLDWYEEGAYART